MPRAISTTPGGACETHAPRYRREQPQDHLGAAQVAFAGTLAMRMRYMQVEQADEFRLLAEENRINMRLIAPARAQLFDRNGQPLAINTRNYRVTLIREQAGDEGAVKPAVKTAEELRRLVKLAIDLEARHERERKRDAGFSGAYGLDLDKARSEIRCKLGRIRRCCKSEADLG